MSTYFKTSVKPKKHFEIVGIYTAINKICDSDFEFFGESHPFWEILYVKDGTLEVIEDENTYLLYGGTVICHAPNEFHRIKSVTDGSHIHVLTVDVVGALPDGIKGGVFALCAQERESFEKCFAQLYYMCAEKGRNQIANGGACVSNISSPLSEVGNPNKIGYEGLLRLTVFLLSLARLTANDRMISTSIRAREYGKIVSTMQKGVCDNLSIDEIAAIHHVSKSYVTKLFKTHAAEGPMRYYSRLRIAKIQQLLLDGLSLSEIAELMHFSSLAYISAFFKNRCGISATEWLERVRGN